MRRALIGVIAAATMSIAGSAFAAKTYVGFAPEPYPPFWVPQADGQWSGWEVEMIDAICAEAKLDCERVPVAWEGIIPALEGHKIDLIMNSMRINAERKKVIDFSKKYYEVQTVIVGNKSDAQGVKPEDMAGKVIGVQVSTGQQAYAEKNFGGTASEIRGYNTQDEAYQDLSAGRIDVVLDGQITAEGFVKSDAGSQCCDIKGVLPSDPSTLGEGYGVGIRKGETEMKAKIDAAIDAIRMNGTYDKITKKYFDFDVYGGE